MHRIAALWLLSPLSAFAGMDQPWNDIEGGSSGAALGLIGLAIAVYGIFKTWPLHCLVFAAAAAIAWISSLAVGGAGGLFIACLFIVWAMRRSAETQQDRKPIHAGGETADDRWSQTAGSYPGEPEVSKHQSSNPKEAGPTPSATVGRTQAEDSVRDRPQQYEPPQSSQSAKAERKRPAYADLGMTTIIRCPRCSQQLQVPAGKLLDIRCKTCGHCFRKLTP